MNVEKISLKYPNNTDYVLSNISFECKKGEILVIMGPSGCGKTSLLNIISGVISSSNGKVYANNNEDLNFGYVFQTPSLIPWQTIRENLLLGVRIRGLIEGDEFDSYINGLLIQYKLINYADKYPSVLSGGMQQRVSILRAVVSGANVLLLDEPFSSSDYIVKRELQEDLAKVVSSKNIIAIMVTHDLIEAVRIADQIIILSNRPSSIKDRFRIEENRSERLKDADILQNKLMPYLDRINKALTSG